MHEDAIYGTWHTLGGGYKLIQFFFFFVKANGNTDFGDVCTSMDGGTISKHI